MTSRTRNQAGRLASYSGCVEFTGITSSLVHQPSTLNHQPTRLAYDALLPRLRGHRTPARQSDAQTHATRMRCHAGTRRFLVAKTLDALHGVLAGDDAARPLPGGEAGVVFRMRRLHWHRGERSAHFSPRIRPGKKPPHRTAQDHPETVRDRHSATKEYLTGFRRAPAAAPNAHPARATRHPSSSR